MNSASNVRFVRIHGRVVPVKGRSSPSVGHQMATTVSAVAGTTAGIMAGAAVSMKYAPKFGLTAMALGGLSLGYASAHAGGGLFNALSRKKKTRT